MRLVYSEYRPPDLNSRLSSHPYIPSSRLDFTAVTDDDLKRLADNCDHATFGRNQEDVHDETYRSAGKLDRAHFLLGFDPERSGVMEAVKEVLLEGYDKATTAIRCELYKLNVYGES